MSESAKDSTGPRLLIVGEKRGVGSPDASLCVIDREIDMVRAHRRANTAVEDEGYSRAWVIDTLYEAVAPEA